LLVVVVLTASSSPHLSFAAATLTFACALSITYFFEGI